MSRAEDVVVLPEQHGGAGEAGVVRPQPAQRTPRPVGCRGATGESSSFVPSHGPGSGDQD